MLRHSSRPRLRVKVKADGYTSLQAGPRQTTNAVAVDIDVPITGFDGDTMPLNTLAAFVGDANAVLIIFQTEQIDAKTHLDLCRFPVERGVRHSLCGQLPCVTVVVRLVCLQPVGRDIKALTVIFLCDV